MPKHEKRRRGFWGWLTGAEPSGEDIFAPSPKDESDLESGGPGEFGEFGEPDELAAIRPEHARSACAVCGGTEFRWDWLESGLYGLGKGPADAQPQKWVKRKTRFGSFAGLRARLCQKCGHVDLFIQQTDKA